MTADGVFLDAVHNRRFDGYRIVSHLRDTLERASRADFGQRDRRSSSGCATADFMIESLREPTHLDFPPLVKRHAGETRVTLERP